MGRVEWGRRKDRERVTRTEQELRERTKNTGAHKLTWYLLDHTAELLFPNFAETKGPKQKKKKKKKTMPERNPKLKKYNQCPTFTGP